MAVFVGKSINFIFDARAIARPDAFDRAIEERRSLAGFAYDVVRSLVCIGNMAGDLWEQRRVAIKAQARDVFVAFLDFESRHIEAMTRDPRWGARFEAAPSDARRSQVCAERFARAIARASGFERVIADMTEPAQNSPRAKHDGAAAIDNASSCQNASHLTRIVEDDVFDFGLGNVEVGNG